jgi:hypothetical protein
MALKVKDVIGLIITYIGTKALGAIPLKPTIGVNIQGTPAMAVDLFAVLGGMFPNLSAAISSTLTNAFNGLALSLGLDPKNLFMSSPLGPIAKDISNTVNSFVSDLKLSANIGMDAVTSEFNTAVGALKSTVDQVMGLPSTAWGSLDAGPGADLISSGAQILSPGALASNLTGTIANSVAIDQAIQQGTSSILLDAAKADITAISSRLTGALDQTARDLLGQELKTKLQSYTGQINAQVAGFETKAAEIGKSLNPVQEMAAQVVPPSINVKAAEALTSKATELAKSAAGGGAVGALAGAAAGSPAISSAQLVAVNNIAQRMNSVVLPVFKEQVLPVIDTQLALEANTSITATTQLAAASTNIVYNQDGNPDGVNLRYG